jgi:hypothetical protein
MPEGKCPICGDAARFADYLEWEGDSWVRCTKCGGGHRVPYEPEVDDPTLAATLYDQTYFESDFFRRRYLFAANQACWLAGHHRPGMTILEIGPGLGLAAERFLESVGGDVAYHVVEPHPLFARHLAERMNKRMVVHTGAADVALEEALREVAAIGNPVLLYMDNVLEHVALPYDMIGQFRDRLPRGSVALFDVPNERGLKWRCRLYRTIGGQPTASPAHINLFTKRSLETMFSRHGLGHEVRQRGIRRPEEVNCLPEGPALSAMLWILRFIPLDTMLGLGNNLRAVARFERPRDPA